MSVQLQRLVDSKIINNEQASLVKRQLDHLGRHGGARSKMSAGDIAVQLGFVTHAQLAQSQAARPEDSHLRPIELPSPLLRELESKILGVAGSTLQIASLKALTEREKFRLIDACAALGQAVVEVVEVPVPAEEILSFLRELAADSQSVLARLEALNRGPQDNTVKEALNSLIREAIQEQASDVHIVCDADILNCLVRYRINGLLHVRHLTTPESARVLTTRIKTVAGLDASLTRRSQDGRISWQAHRRSVDIRVATVPTANGEEIVMRLLDPANKPTLQAQFRDDPEMLELIERRTNLTLKVEGLMLVSGPTGSGKSSTLYGVVGRMNRIGLSIRSTEDPVEQLIPLVSQTNVDPDMGRSFADVLRGQMRADPDVLLVGEIRDRATAETALRSAESGHYVASTLHSNSCEDSLHRMLNLLPPEYRAVGELSIANYLQVLLNLRLAPRVCGACAETVTAGSQLSSPVALERLGLDVDTPVLKPTGCQRCRHTGYIGRVLVAEGLFVPASQEVRKEFLARLSGRSKEPVTKVEGLQYFSRERSVRRLVKANQLDVLTAAQLIGEWS